MKTYKKYKTSDVLLVSRMYWSQEDAAQLGKNMKKMVLYLPCEVDDMPKALNTLTYKQLKTILKTILKDIERQYVKL